MKILYLSMLALISIVSCAAPPVARLTENVSIVEVGEIPANTVYSKTRQWFSSYFNSGESVIDYENPEEGVIIGTGIADLKTTNKGFTFNSLKYNIKVETKDGKIRVTAKPLYYMVGGKSTRYATEEVQRDGQQHLAGMSEIIKSYIQSSKAKQDEEW